MAVAVSSARLNRLLAVLTPEDCERITGHLQSESFERGGVAYEPSELLRYVYFPVTGVFSMLDVIHDMTVEVATVGNEGMLGLPAFLDGSTMPLRVICQVPGEALRLEVEVFRDWASSRSRVHRLLQRYTQALMTQIAQGTACNRAHTNVQRCARWLLLTEDRVGSDTFPLTHEFLAQMLGVRRATVTEIAGELQRQGLIQYQRGIITVTDRAARGHLVRVLPHHQGRVRPVVERPRGRLNRCVDELIMMKRVNIGHHCGIFGPARSKHPAGPKVDRCLLQVRSFTPIAPSCVAQFAQQ